MKLYVLFRQLDDGGVEALFDVEVDDEGVVTDYWVSDAGESHVELEQALLELEASGGRFLEWAAKLEPAYSVEAVDIAPAMVAEVEDLHPALRQLVRDLPDDAAAFADEPHQVQVELPAAIIIVTVLEGESRISVRAFLTGEGGVQESATEQEVQGWIDAQEYALPPRRASATQVPAAVGDGSAVASYEPRLRIEVPVGSPDLNRLVSYVNHCAAAWSERQPVSPTVWQEFMPPEAEDALVPTDAAPQNAWLLMGDEASYPSAQERDDSTADGAIGIYDTLWTAPKNGQVGDLVLGYFISPRKAAHFVARLASEPFWVSDIPVNAETTVASEQWWAYLTPWIEIEPVPFKALEEAQGGKLILRGRSGHFLRPEAIAALQFTAVDSAQQEALRVATQTPVGLAVLPQRDEAISLETWQQIASGALPLEASVSDYVVEPLLSIVADSSLASGVHSWKREFKLDTGWADFVVLDQSGTPVFVIEVKLAVRKAANARWADSPDFKQLRRYMDELHVPGLLVDSRAIYVVELGEETVSRTILRAEANSAELAAIFEGRSEEAL